MLHPNCTSPAAAAAAAAAKDADDDDSTTRHRTIAHLDSNSFTLAIRIA